MIAIQGRDPRAILAGGTDDFSMDPLSLPELQAMVDDPTRRPCACATPSGSRGSGSTTDRLRDIATAVPFWQAMQHTFTVQSGRKA